MTSAQAVALLHKGEFTELALYAVGKKHFVRKSSFYPGSEKLVDEANFIKQSLPETARPYFPEIIGEKTGHSEGTPYYYDMPYYSGTLLRQKIINTRGKSELVTEVIRDTLTILKRTLYCAAADEAPVTFMQKHYIDRLVSRLSKYTKPTTHSLQSATSSDLLTRSQIEEFFEAIISRPRAMINDRELLTPLEVLRQVQADNTLGNLLLPPAESMGMIHGDPHLGNIFIREDSATPLFFDPNGFHKGGDIAYDLGKFILSLDYLDMLLERMIIYPRIAWNEGSVRISSLRNFKEPGKARKIKTIFGLMISDVLPTVFADNIRKDPWLIERSIFAASLHAFACAHTFIPTEQKDAAIPLLVHFLRQANDQLERLKKSVGGVRNNKVTTDV